MSVTRRKKSVNQTLIAKQLNVSVGTVSKAIRGLPDVKAETVEKVHKLAKSLGYELNGAQPFGKYSDYGLVVALINKSTYRSSRSGYLEGLSNEAVNSGLSVISHYIQDTELDSVLDAKRLPWVMNQKELVKGLVLIHTWPEELVSELAKRWPCVSITHEYPNSGADFVGVNAANGISLLMDQLREKEHTKIGFFGHSSALSWSRARLTGYTDALFRLGLEVKSNWIIEVEATHQEHERNWEHFYDQIVELAEKDGVSAWMCASDLAGYELYQGLTRRGIKVPEQIAITGFDTSPNSIFTTKRLTSVRLKSDQMGAAAIRLLMARSADPHLSRQVFKVDCDLQDGQTV